MTSIEFPIALPNGSSIEVITVVIDLLSFFPTLTIRFASCSAFSAVFNDAPEPYFTSIIMFPAPVATFFATTEAVISGIESIKLVVYFMACKVLLAGAMLCVFDEIATLILLSCRIISEIARPVLNPGIDFSLSIVPPV